MPMWQAQAPVGASKYNSALYMAFLHMWRKERQGKSGEVGSHARDSLYYMVEHWERHLYGGGQESGRLTPIVAPQLK